MSHTGDPVLGRGAGRGAQQVDADQIRNILLGYLLDAIKALSPLNGTTLVLSVRSLAADGVYEDSDYLIEEDTTAANRTLTLPDPTLFRGRVIAAVKTDASGNHIVLSGSVNGGASLNVTAQNVTLRLQSNGTTWRT